MTGMISIKIDEIQEGKKKEKMKRIFASYFVMFLCFLLLGLVAAVSYTHLFSSIPNVSLLLLSFRASKPDREVIEKRAKKSFLFRSNVIGVFTWVVFVFRVVATIKQFSI